MRAAIVTLAFIGAAVAAPVVPNVGTDTISRVYRRTGGGGCKNGDLSCGPPRDSYEDVGVVTGTAYTLQAQALEKRDRCTEATEADDCPETGFCYRGFCSRPFATGYIADLAPTGNKCTHATEADDCPETGRCYRGFCIPRAATGYNANTKRMTQDGTEEDHERLVSHGLLGATHHKRMTQDGTEEDHERLVSQGLLGATLGKRLILNSTQEDHDSLVSQGVRGATGPGRGPKTINTPQAVVGCAPGGGDHCWTNAEEAEQWLVKPFITGEDHDASVGSPVTRR